MDPIRNPYAPGAGQRPPELAGRDRELEQFDVTLERVAAGRPERSMVLSGLRGVGKTVLLNVLRGQAVKRAWGTGKIEARPDRSVRLPVAQAVHAAVREVAHRHRDPDRVDAVAGVLKSFALRTAADDRKGFRWTPPVDVPAARGRADSGDLELDLVELFRDVATLAGDLGWGWRSSSTRCRTSPAPSSPRCAGPATRSASGRPRCSSWAPGCRTCRSRSRPRSPTPSGSSATSRWTGCRARWPTGPGGCRRRARASTSPTTRS